MLGWHRLEWSATRGATKTNAFFPGLRWHCALAFGRKVLDLPRSCSRVPFAAADFTAGLISTTPATAKPALAGDPGQSCRSQRGTRTLWSVLKWESSRLSSEAPHWNEMPALLRLHVELWPCSLVCKAFRLHPSYVQFTGQLGERKGRRDSFAIPTQDPCLRPSHAQIVRAYRKALTSSHIRAR